MFQLLMYIRYIFLARHRKGHGIHSPFVYDLITKCLNSSRDAGSRIAEGIRKQALSSDEVLNVTDYGAGTRKHLPPARPLSTIMKQTAISRKSGQILSNLAAHYRPRTILELGTGLGISTMYLANGNPSARLITIEGSSEIAHRASMHFKAAGCKQIELMVGRFSEFLPAVLAGPDHPLMVVVDGDHREKSLLDIISLLIPVLQDDSIIIIDDIHLSREMHRAWEKIVIMPEVRLSVDLFRMGLLFFRNEIFKPFYMFRV